MMIWVLSVLNFAAMLAIAGALVMKYRSTKDRGFILLTAGLVLWPVIRIGLGFGVEFVNDQLVDGRFPMIFPFSLVLEGTMTVGEFVALSLYLMELVERLLLLVP